MPMLSNEMNLVHVCLGSVPFSSSLLFRIRLLMVRVRVVIGELNWTGTRVEYNSQKDTECKARSRSKLENQSRLEVHGDGVGSHRCAAGAKHVSVSANLCFVLS